MANQKSVIAHRKCMGHRLATGRPETVRLTHLFGTIFSLWAPLSLAHRQCLCLITNNCLHRSICPSPPRWHTICVDIYQSADVSTFCCSLNFAIFIIFLCARPACLINLYSSLSNRIGNSISGPHFLVVPATNFGAHHQLASITLGTLTLG